MGLFYKSPKMEDRELVEQITTHGQTKYFAVIVNRYSGMIFSKVMGVVHREDMAAEVMQQTFVRAYEQLDVWRGQQLGPWLVTIALHTALHLLEKERRRRGQTVEEISDKLTETYDYEREEMIQCMEAAIHQLPENEQQIIHLYYYQQQKTIDIANATGLSQSNVMVKLHRIREKLKKILSHERYE